MFTAKFQLCPLWDFTPRLENSDLLAWRCVHVHSSILASSWKLQGERLDTTHFLLPPHPANLTLWLCGDVNNGQTEGLFNRHLQTSQRAATNIRQPELSYDTSQEWQGSRRNVLACVLWCYHRSHVEIYISLYIEGRSETEELLTQSLSMSYQATGFGPWPLRFHLCLWTHFIKWVKSGSPKSLQKEKVRVV